VSTSQRPPESPSPADPPGTWPLARRAARRVLSPVERFLSIEAASGILLLLAALVALLWANSPWRASYQALWHLRLGVRLGSLAFERDLHFWINDGLMAVFFFVIGLEIRRELYAGELSDRRRAVLPLVAAAGGMLVPAGLYLGFNGAGPAAHGWGVPMATDIAFAVGVLALLGKRVPPSLRVLLLTLAVVDDLGAILVIAAFYSSGIGLVGLLIAAVGVALVLGMQKVGVRAPLLYLAPAVVVWAGAIRAGVHPTLAGVAIGLLTPVRAWYGAGRFLEQADASVQAIRVQGDLDGRGMMPHLDALDEARREAVAPVERLEHALHGWVAYLIMPLFAFANAGVSLGSASLEGAGLTTFLGIMFGLALGKPMGVLALSWLAVKLRLGALPSGLGWRHLVVLGLVAGIGFTMALFIAGLAFDDEGLLETAKLAILCGSALAAVAGLAIGRWVLRSPA
jgi:NhaA family Na+:H+ antiporter